MGMVPHLLRIWLGEAAQRRHRMAPSDRHGRVLPERSSAYLDRLGHPAFAPLVPLGDGTGHAGDGTGHRMDDPAAPPLAHDLLLYRHPMGNWGDLHRQLYLSELPGFDAWISLVGRPFLRPLAENQTGRGEDPAATPDAREFRGRGERRPALSHRLCNHRRTYFHGLWPFAITH